jgi:hypothetical protein
VSGCIDNGWGWLGFGAGYLPPRQRLIACGYDPHCYIATAGLSIFPYTTQAAITARFSGAQDLINATDDQQSGQLNQTILNQTILNVSREINGLISTIYPIPLMQTGTVAIIQVTAVSSTGAITAIDVVEAGGYATAPPAGANNPVYLWQPDPLTLAQQDEWNQGNWWDFQTGTGAILTPAYTTTQITQPDGSTVPAYSVSGTPTITNGGTAYNQWDILVLVGGASFVPDKIANAATLMVCYELIRRRLTPDEQNLFSTDAKAVKKELLAIGNGDLDLDGTYRRFYSAVASQNTQSMLQGNSA